MGWSDYGAFLAFAVILVLVPGPDFAVVTKNTLAAGPRRGRWTAVGVCSSNVLQGTAAAAGLSAMIVRAQPVFAVLKWAGVCYLAFLGLQALRAAWGGRAHDPGAPPTAKHRSREALSGWRQGFLSNVTNPKVLLFYLAVLPQFLRPGASPGWLLAFAWSHALLSVLYLQLVVTGIHRLKGVLFRRRVRRTMDGVTGLALLGFSARLAVEQA